MPSHPEQVMVAAGGKEIKFHTPDPIAFQRVAELRGLATSGGGRMTEPETVAWVADFEPESVFFGIGANIGIYSILAAALKNAKVHAFEPFCIDYLTLNKNIDLNGLKNNMSAYCVSVSDYISISSLFSARLAPGAGNFFGESKDVFLQESPKRFRQGSLALSLDMAIFDLGLPAPRYLKIDVDGLEHKVISGATQLLENGSGLKEILIEINPVLAEHRKILDFLERRGFAYDPTQVEKATVTEGRLQGMANYIFRR